MTENKEQNFESKLKKTIEIIDIANVLTVPLTDSIRSLLEISSASMNSREASVLIRDGGEGNLRFLCAIGQVAEHLLDVKIPAGRGIAGFVFSSGQPMSISNAESEETFYPEVDKQTGFSTQTILATPLHYEGEIIGVLEYVNRIGEPPYEPFTPEEMDKAVIYAEAIASLVNAYESAQLHYQLSDKILSSEKDLNVADLRIWLSNFRDSDEHKEMTDLAILVRELALRGSVERRLCREILESILSYSDSSKNLEYTNL